MAGLEPRSRVEVEFRDGEVILRRVRTVAELAGILRDRVKPGTTFEDERRSAMKALVEEVMGGD
jgi:bifunctional DNA-binding transcriptional regulator/antitoxin component of YhaV-PrlF toxin-antitoxin module